VRLAVGCVGPVPRRLSELEAKIRGQDVEEAQRIVWESKQYLFDKLEPVDDILGSAEYKMYMTRVLLGRALTQATNGTKGV
jgi:CO/xanthine dehydrogenase FAD-binding subunit